MEIGIGFTGTHKGWTEPQKERLYNWGFFKKSGYIYRCHHGDCVGADANFHHMIRFYKLTNQNEFKLIGHPPINNRRRAFCEEWDECFDPKPYRERDHDIVNQTQIMIATPAMMKEEIRSGTWMTVRYARKQERTIFIFWPDGTLDLEFNINGRSTRHKISASGKIEEYEF